MAPKYPRHTPGARHLTVPVAVDLNTVVGPQLAAKHDALDSRSRILLGRMAKSAPPPLPRHAIPPVDRIRKRWYHYQDSLGSFWGNQWRTPPQRPTATCLSKVGNRSRSHPALVSCQRDHADRPPHRCSHRGIRRWSRRARGVGVRRRGAEFACPGGGRVRGADHCGAIPARAACRMAGHPGVARTATASGRGSGVGWRRSCRSRCTRGVHPSVAADVRAGRRREPGAVAARLAGCGTSRRTPAQPQRMTNGTLAARPVDQG
jgi:hypothetical protein